MAMSDKNNKLAPSDAEVEHWLFDALRLAGELPPSSFEEIALLEAELEANPVALPESLRNADAIFERVDERTRAKVIPFPELVSTRENLARAARARGRISKTAESRMEEDRRREEENDGER